MIIRKSGFEWKLKLRIANSAKWYGWLYLLINCGVIAKIVLEKNLNTQVLKLEGLYNLLYCTNTTNID